MDADVKVLKQIRSNFAAAAASCNKGAKTLVQAASDLIAARKHGRRGKAAKIFGRLRG